MDDYDIVILVDADDILDLPKKKNFHFHRSVQQMKFISVTVSSTSMLRRHWREHIAFFKESHWNPWQGTIQSIAKSVRI